VNKILKVQVMNVIFVSYIECSFLVHASYWSLGTCVYKPVFVCVSCCICVLLLCAGYTSVPSNFGAVSKVPVKTGVYWCDKRDSQLRQNGGVDSLFHSPHSLACLLFSCHAFIVLFSPTNTFTEWKGSHELWKKAKWFAAYANKRCRYWL
jgi:hypothetical protein